MCPSIIGKKRCPTMKTKVKKRILAMLAAASLFITPSVVQAQNIAKADASKAGTITVDGKVTNVLPDRTVNGGNTAINQFANFELDSGNIANLQFEKASTLVNFVDSKASINRIVNAVKDNKIGGNLYFLSPNGIAVGASGVINAGKVGLIVPHQDSYDKMLKADNLSDSDFTQKKINQIPLNSDGSIVVEGNINAPNGITLAAQNVKIESGAKLINTNTIDFSSLVNTVEGVENSLGLDSDLVLKADKNGGIYITARVDNTTVEDNVSFSDMIGFGVEKLDEPLTASITVGNGAEIISDSDVTLSSTAVADRSYKDGTSLTSNFLGLKSEIDVAGSIKARNINLESTIADTAKLDAAKNIDINAASEITTKLTSQASSKDNSGAAALNATFFQNSSILNIDGTIKAGGDISLSSTAGADISSIANVSFDKNKNTATSLAMNLALGNNQSYLATSSTADINAGGKIDVSSLANSPVNVETSLKREGSGLGALTLSGVSIESYSLLNAEGTLTAKGNINVSSKYTAPTYKVNTEISVTKPVSGMEQTEEEEEKTQSTGSAISNFINGLQEEDSDGESTSSNNITSNATVVISKHSAYLGLGKVTSSAGNVNIEAANVIDDPQIGAISVVPVEAGEGITVTPVIVYSTIDKNSLINLTDDITAKSIKVKSNLSLDNPRLDQVKDDILEIKPQLEKVYRKRSVKAPCFSCGDETAQFYTI